MQRLRVTLHCAKLSAAIALVLFYLTSCTNYWLHAITYPSVNDTTMAKLHSNSTGTNQDHFSEKGNSTGVMQPVVQKKEYFMTRRRHNAGRTHFQTQWSVTYHHEGFFWRCWFTDQWVEDTISKFIFFNQPPTKCCIHAYHSPFPSIKETSSSEFESWIVYRRLWSALMFLAVIFITIGCVIITFRAYRIYKFVGAIFLLSAVLYSTSLIMYAYWISAVPQMITANQAIMQDNMDVIIDKSEVKFGWSFMAAPVAAFFSLVAGLLFIKVSDIASKEQNSII
ncbi:transmembrane protein 182-like [Mustelus asterias]